MAGSSTSPPIGAVPHLLPYCMSKFVLRSDKAVRRIVEACRYGDSRLIITPQAKILHTVNTLLPGVYAPGTRIAVRLLPGPAGALPE